MFHNILHDTYHHNPYLRECSNVFKINLRCLLNDSVEDVKVLQQQIYCFINNIFTLLFIQNMFMTSLKHFCGRFLTCLFMKCCMMLYRMILQMCQQRWPEEGITGWLTEGASSAQYVFVSCLANCSMVPMSALWQAYTCRSTQAQAQ